MQIAARKVAIFLSIGLVVLVLGSLVTGAIGQSLFCTFHENICAMQGGAPALSRPSVAIARNQIAALPGQLLGCLPILFMLAGAWALRALRPQSFRLAASILICCCWAVIFLNESAFFLGVVGGFWLMILDSLVVFLLSLVPIAVNLWTSRRMAK